MQAEKEKMAKFRDVDAPELINSGLLTPFVVEATGRLGPAARQLIDKRTGTSTTERTYFLNCMAAAIAVFNACAYGCGRGGGSGNGGGTVGGLTCCCAVVGEEVGGAGGCVAGGVSGGAALLGCFGGEAVAFLSGGVGEVSSFHNECA